MLRVKNKYVNSTVLLLSLGFSISSYAGGYTEMKCDAKHHQTKAVSKMHFECCNKSQFGLDDFYWCEDDCGNHCKGDKEDNNCDTGLWGSSSIQFKTDSYDLSNCAYRESGDDW